jgi:hypothetical protein
MSSQIDMFSEARIAFEQECRQHPKIAMKIILEANEVGYLDEGIAVGIVAAEFNIVMDGVYSRDQMEDMYTMLFHRLREHRKESIIYTPPSTLLPPGIMERH